MFTQPRTWVHGESGIRAESFNNSLPRNLDAVRDLCSSFVVFSATYPGSTLEIPDNPGEGSAREFNFPSTIYDTQTPPFWEGSTVPSRSDEAIIWIPYGSLAAAAKSSTGRVVYWNVQITAEPVAYQDPYTDNKGNSYPGHGFLDERSIPTQIRYQYLGSDVDSSPGPSDSNERLLSLVRITKIRSNKGVVLSTGNVPINTNDMSTTNVSICAYRLSLRVLGAVQAADKNSIGLKNFGICVTVGVE